MTRLRIALVILWAALVLQAAMLGWMGLRIVRRPGTLRNTSYSSHGPTTGPCTTEEMKSAEGHLRMLSAMTGATTQADDVEQVRSVVEGQRQMEGIRRTLWEDRQQKAVEQAAARRPVGVILLSLALGLMLVWTFLARRLWRSERFSQ